MKAASSRKEGGFKYQNVIFLGQKRTNFWAEGDENPLDRINNTAGFSIDMWKYESIKEE